MRCPDCNKFVSFNEEEPETESLDVDEDGTVTASVRIVNSCAECGTEMKEATLEMSASVEEHKCDEAAKAKADAEAKAKYDEALKRWEAQKTMKPAGMENIVEHKPTQFIITRYGEKTYSQNPVLENHELTEREKLNGYKLAKYRWTCKVHTCSIFTDEELKENGGCPSCIREAKQKVGWMEKEPQPPSPSDDEEGDFEVEEVSSERDQRTEGKGRYMKTFYGARLEVKVTCRKCGHEEDLSMEEYVQASGMDEMV